MLVTDNIVHSSTILVTQMMELIRSSERSVLKKITRRNIPEDVIIRAHNIVHRSTILVTLMMEAIRSSETLVLIRATRLNIPKDGILRGRYSLIS
jgi:uncharacterized protein YbcV (DUF1398 family)